MDQAQKKSGPLSQVILAARVACLILLLSSAATAQSIKLDQKWFFFADKSSAVQITSLPPAQNWRRVRVGLSWNAQFEDLRDYMGVGWYRTTFETPALRDGRRALLRFDAVDYYSEVFVNGKAVGTHEGGYTPFTFDVTDALRAGVNNLVVRVVDPPMDEKENRARFPGMLYNEIPHGKQNWYVQTGGIWQPVWLELKPKEYITSVKVTAKLDGSVSVLVFSNAHLGPPPPMPPSPPPGPTSGREVRQQTVLDLIHVRVTDPAGKGFDLKLKGGRGVAVNDYVYFEGRIPAPQLWSLRQPILYTVVVTLGNDEVTDRFGFRQFEARDGKFYLNGESFYMIAALDQDFYPETIYTPPSSEYVRDEMLKARRMGLNLLRCHIKVCDPTYLRAADEVGMLVWYEIPSWNDSNHFTATAAERGEKTFREMVERDWNHPSIVVQSIVNESWGADLKQEDQRRWLRAAYERARKLTAPLGRLIVDNSACCDNFHIKTDIEDNHRYNSVPDDHEAFDNWVADFAARPKWNFSPFGDAEPTGKEPLVVSEFGNWGLPKLPKDLPWWFGRDFGGRPVTRPAGVLGRFREFQFYKLFGDYNALAEATEWHQFISLKHEIEEIRRYPSIQGYVITEFTDINWEANGLMDMWRNPKVYAAEIAKIQQPDVILARTSKVNYGSGERVEVATFLSHYSGKGFEGATVSWSTDTGARGQFSLNNANRHSSGYSSARASVESLQSFSFVAPVVNQPRREQLRLELHGVDGSLIAENSYELFIYPAMKPASAPRKALTFYDPRNSNPQLRRALTAAGYEAGQAEKRAPALLMIATTLDDFVENHLRRGGRAVVIADSSDAFPTNASLKATPRAGSDLDGNWVTNFNWVRSDADPFREVAVTKILGFESQHIVPRYVIEGVTPQNYDDVLAGVFYGWLNNNSALVVQLRAGKGAFLATTFRFDKYGDDPFATRLLDAMIDYVDRPGFSPNTEYRQE
ncbi:MAG: hypothetical protein M3Y84_08340 [Acidobacteriota bacterium]|nr:hypothetical protein [Acidobacteriota bacterium]